MSSATAFRLIFVSMVAWNLASLLVSEILLRPEIFGVDWIGYDAFISPGGRPPPPFSVDVLSVASIHRMELLDAQKRTFALHSSIRNFFNATELDDHDPTCYKDLTWEEVRTVSTFCRSYPPGLSHLSKCFRRRYATMPWLSKKPNPVGWLCAIPRPYAGLRKAYIHYQQRKEPLPDYFIILDDDTYYNMETFQQNHEKLNSSEPTVVAGCRVQLPVMEVNFTFPWGGFGTIFSKGSLDYLFRPVVCLDGLAAGNGTFPMIINHPNHEAICNQLSKDVAGELKHFRNGMSLLDLIYAYVHTERYRDVKNWTTGFCMHSDWVMGYFVNFYNASTHDSHPFYRNVPQARMGAYKNSYIYSRPTGFCKYDGGNCPPGSDICHKPTIQWMERETLNWNNPPERIKKERESEEQRTAYREPVQERTLDLLH